MIARFRLGYANRAVATAGEEHGVVVRCGGEMSASWPWTKPEEAVCSSRWDVLGRRH